jgi:hypothetical protein
MLHTKVKAKKGHQGHSTFLLHLVESVNEDEETGGRWQCAGCLLQHCVHREFKFVEVRGRLVTVGQKFQPQATEQAIKIGRAWRGSDKVVKAL